MGSIYITLNMDGQWVVCEPSGAALTTSMGIYNLFIPNSATFIDNSNFEELKVSSITDLLGDDELLIQISHDEIVYVERAYHS